jgi:hypothetical protein
VAGRSGGVANPTAVLLRTVFFYLCEVFFIGATCYLIPVPIALVEKALGTETIQALTSRPLCLRQLKRGKFTQPVVPGTIVIACREVPGPRGPGGWVPKVRAGDEPVASLAFEFDPLEEGLEPCG